MSAVLENRRSANSEVETLENPTEISGEPLLQKFVLNLSEIWD